MKRNCFIHARYRKNLINPDTGFYSQERLSVEPPKPNVHIMGNGGITIAILKNEDGTLSWGFSKCNIIDTFSKKRGIHMATIRAKNWNIKTKDFDFKTILSFSNELAEEIERWRVNALYKSFKSGEKNIQNWIENYIERNKIV